LGREVAEFGDSDAPPLPVPLDLCSEVLGPWHGVILALDPMIGYWKWRAVGCLPSPNSSVLGTRCTRFPPPVTTMMDIRRGERPLYYLAMQGPGGHVVVRTPATRKIHLAVASPSHGPE
jgi:hypothetical protein